MQPAQRHLVLLRHAKSAWPNGVPDLRGPLAKRGRRDAAAVGCWLHEHAPRLDAVVCSPAERARQTLTLVAAELDDPPPASYDERVYKATAPQLLALVRDLVGAENHVTSSDQHLAAGQPSPSPSSATPA